MICLMLLFSVQLGAAAGVAPSAASPKPDARGVQLLQQAQKAMGGAEKLAAVKDTTQTMTVTLAPPFEKSKISQTIRYIAPSRIRQEQEGNFGKSVIYSDGISGHKTTKNGTTPLMADAVAASRAILFRQPCALMLSDRDPSRTVKAVGVSAVEISSSDGQTVKVEFDPKTGLPTRQSYPISSNGKAATRTETFSDWREVSGVRLPFRSVQLDGDKKVLEQAVSAYKVNTGLTAAELSKP